QPLEEGVLRIARTGERRARPSLVILLATLRSCPCGGLPPQGCACAPLRLARYRRRAAEPIGHLFDPQCEMGSGWPPGDRADPPGALATGDPPGHPPAGEVASRRPGEFL